ncbi:initiator tRNA phosphoribosyl transferase [Coprinopsis sp. MPI-PUGE-AT-0042]|nr:initiator tRNA phosphoribosyl transferase [Coprinopsis sp. MPI-PUGE-AT-0042]
MQKSMALDALAAIRKESLDVYNRLHSIEEDVQFVHQVRVAYPKLPILPNLRCGAWYTDPDIATDIPAYFKSTDGHYGNWGFNLRRSNLHLLAFLVESNGLILVDSTRAGKRVPDALSKTVPIWCAVVNRATLKRYPLLLASPGWDTDLYTPPAVVSAHEHNSILARLEAWAEALANSSFDLPRLPRPLRPLWITPSMSRFPDLPDQVGFIPIICLSASKQVGDGIERRAGGSYTYVQGSGDDHELWGMGLTPELFWANKSRLLAAGREEFPQLVESIVNTRAPEVIDPQNTKRKRPTPVVKIQNRIWIGSIAEVGNIEALSASHHAFGMKESPPGERSMAYVLILEEQQGDDSMDVGDSSNTQATPHHIQTFNAPSNKSQFYDYFRETILPSSLPFIEAWLKNDRDICICCPNGKDLSVGVALMAIGKLFSEDGRLVGSSGGEVEGDDVPLTKKTLKTRLEWIIASRPTANPARTTLKRVNEFLLTPSVFLKVGKDLEGMSID